MKRIGYKDVAISISELVVLSGKGLKADAIKKYCSRSNAKDSSVSWLNEPDPTDGRKILIKYTSIPKQTVTKYQLPDVTVLIDQIKHDKELERAYQVQQEIEFTNYKLDDCIKKAANEEFVKYCPTYNKLFPNKKANEKKAKVIEMAKTHAVLQCCIDLKAGYKIAELHEAYLKTPGVKHSLKSLEKFRQKLVEGEKQGINIIHKYTGKAREHLVKLSAWHIGEIEKYYSNPNKYTAKMIHELLTKDCKDFGKTLVSVDSVSKYVAKPEVKNRLSVYRDKDYYRRVVQPSTRRLAPTFSADLYYADGSPVQMTCWNSDNTKQIRLNLFVVMDVKSKKIIGFDLAESEDRYNWFAAFKMAFTTQMLLPYELMYDNASATKTSEFKALKEALLLKGCNLNPTTKGEPKQKADIERWFGTFQSGFQRMIDGFVGEGIRTKRDNGKIDVEHLSHLQKAKGTYSQSDMIEITTNLIAIYNSKVDAKGISPNKIFSESERPNAQPINAADLAVLFMNYRKLKVTNSEVKITIRHNEYYFNVYDHATGLKLDGTQVNVYYDETDMQSVHLFDLNQNYICECRAKVQFHKAKANQTEKDVEQIIKQSKHYEAKKIVAKQLSDAIAAGAMKGNEETFLQSTNPYEVALKDVVNDAETKMMLDYMQDRKGLQFTGLYTPAVTTDAPNPVKNKPTIQERHAKKNIVPATFQTIERP